MKVPPRDKVHVALERDVQTVDYESSIDHSGSPDQQNNFAWAACLRSCMIMHHMINIMQACNPKLIMYKYYWLCTYLQL